MRQDETEFVKKTSDPKASLAGQQGRFGVIGMREKLIAGALVILCCWLSLGLGFLAFGGFLYLHLLLRDTPHFHHSLADTDIIAPLSGQILAVRHDEQGVSIDIAGDGMSSQLIYAPLSARIEDKLWIDGTYMAFDDATSHPLRARYDFLAQSTSGDVINLSLFGTSLTRYIHAPFVEGQNMVAQEAFAFGLLRSYLTLQLPKSYQPLISQGDYCIAKQTLLAKKV